MANKDDYLTFYREFFDHFAQTVNPNDQLPVKLASYKLVNIEVVGGIIDWTTQYLTQKNCPPCLIAPLIKIVIEEIRKACKKQPLLCGFIPADNAYEPLKLMQTVMAKTNEICLRFLDNSMLCSLPSPGAPYFITSVHAVKNTRRRMEDRHVVIHDLNTMFNIQEASPSSYYAIFDGHAGHDAAAYSSAHLHQYLAENKHFATNPEQALLDAFCKTDALFIDKCKVEGLTSGTTAVCALLRPKEKTLYIAWVGDSQALVVKQEKILQCVDPHKPSRQDERERIEKQGGCVILWGTWRVNGQLAVSRAIGDWDYKPFVIAIPDIREISLDGNEDFVILACDGLWDFLSEDAAARAVYNLVMENPDDTDRISQHLVQLSKQQGSTDNISVIVVFLREPSKISAEAHWANRNGSPYKMDTSLDNANNPFANGANTDNIFGNQKTDELLLNLTDNYKQNGTDLDLFGQEKSNGKLTTREFDDDDDLGPETDVDAVDDVLMSPSIAAAKAMCMEGVNNNSTGVFNPFMEHQEKAAMEIDFELQKQQSSEFDGARSPREETPTPPADAVHDAGLVENAAESDSEDEWNYIKGEEANKENINPVQPETEVAEDLEDMSQLNPNAAEFVPVSPTRSAPSPACRALINDQVLSQSPRRPPPQEIDINLPNPQDFETEAKSRPSDFEAFSNGHDSDSDSLSPVKPIENLLNGKNIDEIPEFQPGSTPTKNAGNNDEFHFGINAVPFTPGKLLDQSEAALSTKAVYGDESTATLGTSFNESIISQDNTDYIMNKEKDPMSMSFYQEKEGETTNPFDLNEVQELPENLDEFLGKSGGNNTLDNTISDLPEHSPLSGVEKYNDVTLNNDDVIQVTDLDKPMDDEKELASPLSDDESECKLPKSPVPVQDLLGDFCQIPQDRSPVPSASPFDISESKSPIPDVSESKSPVPDILETKSPEPDISESKSPVPDLSEQKSPVPDISESKSPIPDIFEAKSPIPSISETSDRPESTSPVCNLPETKSPICGLPEAPSPVCDSPTSPVEESKSPVCDISDAKFPVCDISAPKSPVGDIIIESELVTQEAKSPELLESKSPIPEREESPLPEAVQRELDALTTETPEPDDEILKCSRKDDEIVESPLEDITSSVKDDASSPIKDSPVESPLPVSQDNETVPVHDNLLQEVVSSPVSQEPIPDICQLSTPTDTVTTVDDNSFLNRSQLPEVASPLSPTEQEINNALDLTHPLSRCVYPLPTEASAGESIDIKTENITPQFAEPAIVTPSEESKHSDDLVAVEEPTKPEPQEIVAPVVEVEPPTKEVAENVAPAVAAGVVAAAATTAGIAAAVEKKSSAAKPKVGAVKKPAATKAPTPASRTTSKPSTKPATTTTSRLNAKPTATAPRTGVTKTTTATAPKPAAKTSPKPKTTTAPPKPAPERKSLTNGDAKPAVRSSLTARKSADTKASPKPSTTTATKTTSPTKPRPATAPTRLASSTTAASKPRPTTLSARSTAASSTTTRTTTTTTARTTLASKSATSPTKPSATLKPRVPNTSSTLKPRVPLSKTVSKSPVDEKQNKESANKLTASRTNTARTTSATGTGRTTTTTVRRVESKVGHGSKTTVSKTTTTTMKTIKKPAEITRTVTKTTKTPTKAAVEKPKENGTISVVSEINVINNGINESETQLLKDNSPVDNKLLTDTLIQTNTAD